jgi:hypothetical protein
MPKQNKFKPGNSGNPETMFKPGNRNCWVPGVSGNPTADSATFVDQSPAARGQAA